MSKKQWKNIDLSLQFSIKSDWSQEEVDAPLSDVNVIRSSLPTKTNATRQNAELDNISENGPFILNFSNMSFDATETQLRNFFQAFDIYRLELNNPRRGAGHIEFTNINDLAAAWKLNDKMFLNRPLRLNIPLKDDIVREQAMGNKPKFQQQQKPSTMNSDESDNWRVKKSQPPITPGQTQPASSTPKESSSISKIEEQSNWRPRVARPVENVSETASSDQSAWRNRAPKTESPPTDSSAWRNQTRPQRTDKVDPKAETNINEKSNWRATSAKDSAQETLSDAKDNWRKPESAESRPLAKEEKNESMKSSESVSTKKIPVFGDAKPVDTTAKYLETEAKLQETVPPKSNPWAKKSFNSSANEKAIDKLDWREKKTTPEQVKETVNVKVVEEMPKKPEPQLAPAPKVNVWEERKKSKGVQQTSPVVATTVSGKVDIGNKEENVRRNVGGHDTVKGTVGGHDTVKGTVGGHDTVKGTVGGHDTVKGTVGGHDTVKGTVGGQDTVKGTVGRHDAVKVTVEGHNTVKGNLSVQLAKEDGVVSEESTSGVVGDAKISPRQGAVKISVNGPYLDPKSHRTPQHSVSEITATSISSTTNAPSIVNEAPTENSPIISVAQSPISSKPSRSIVQNSSWAQGPPKGLKQQGQSMSSTSGGH